MSETIPRAHFVARSASLLLSLLALPVLVLGQGGPVEIEHIRLLNESSSARVELTSQAELRWRTELDQEGWEARDDLTVLAIDDAWVRAHD